MRDILIHSVAELACFELEQLYRRSTIVGYHCGTVEMLLLLLHPDPKTKN
jgi:hypothetical protein